MSAAKGATIYSGAHTPGPWRVAATQTGRFPAYPIAASIAGQSVQVASVPIMARGGSNHDAHLIAAAPELLAALQMLEQAVNTEYPEGAPFKFRRLLLEAEAAIAKATGAA